MKNLLALLFVVCACVDTEATPEEGQSAQASLIPDTLTVMGDLNVMEVANLRDTNLDGALVVGSGLDVFGQTIFHNLYPVEMQALHTAAITASGSINTAGDVFRGVVHTARVGGAAASGGGNTKATSGLGVHVGWRLTKGPASPMIERAVVFPMPATDGDRIRSWTVKLEKHTSPQSCMISARMYRLAGPYDESPIGAGAVAVMPAVSEYEIGETGWLEPVEDGYQYYIVVLGCGWSSDVVYSASISTDRQPI